MLKIAFWRLPGAIFKPGDRNVSKRVPESILELLLIMKPEKPENGFLDLLKLFRKYT